MKTSRILPFCSTSAIALVSFAAYAHAPVFTCEHDSDDVRCEAGFSDGSSATGMAVTVLDADHRVVTEGTIDADGTYTFAAPAGEFHVFFNGGQYHEITLYSTDID